MLALASAMVTVSDVFYCVLLYFNVPLLRERDLGVPYGNMHLGDSLRYYAPGDFDCKYEGIAVLCT